MRLFFSAFFSTIAFVAACGGGDAAGPAPSTPAGSSASPGSTSSADAGPTTTTTTTLGSGQDLTGAKLTTASSSSAETGSNTPPEPHAQEPGRSVQDIRTIVMSHRDEARKCYDDGLKLYPSAEGDLDVKFTIDPKGNVTDAAVNEDKSSIHASGIGSCIVGVIKKIHFADSPKGFETRAHYPFNFHPKQAAPSHSSN